MSKRYTARKNYLQTNSPEAVEHLTPVVKQNPYARINKLLQESKTLTKIASDMSSDVMYQMDIKKPFKDTSSKAGNPLMLDFIDIALQTPKKSTAQNIMMKAIDNNAVRYTHQGTAYRTNLHTINKGISAAQNAMKNGKFTGIVYDLETITGKNNNGKDLFTAITEVSMKAVNNNFEITSEMDAIIGLNADQESTVRTMLSEYMSGKTTFENLPEQAKVAVQEILNFNEAKVSDNLIKVNGFDVYQTLEKKSREDIELKIKSKTGSELADELESGIRKLRNWHDSSQAEEALQYVSKQLGAIDGKTTFGIGANILGYDNNVLRSMGLTQGASLDSFLDITEMWRQRVMMTGKEVRGGAQQSNIYHTIFGMDKALPGVAHIASTDTKMSLEIAQDLLTSDLTTTLSQKEKQSKNYNFKVGGIYKTGHTIQSPMGFALSKDGSIVASTGYFRNAADTESGTVRDFAYNINLTKDLSYELVDHQLVDVSQLSEEQSGQLRDIMGDKYQKEDSIHMIAMRPVLDSNSPDTMDASTRYLFLGSRDFDAALGDLERVGTVDIDATGKSVVKGLYGHTPKDIVKHNTEALDYHVTEKAVRTFEEDPYKMLTDFNLFYKGHEESILALSDAIATGNVGKINEARSQINDEMRRFYVSAKKSNAPELSEKLSYSAERLVSLLPVYDEFNELANADHIEEINRGHVFNNVFDNFTRSLEYTSSTNSPIQVARRKKKLNEDSIILHLPGMARANAQTDAMTLRFGTGESSDRFKIADRLLSFTDTKLRGNETTDELTKVGLLKSFVENLADTKSYDGITKKDVDAITAALQKNQLIDSKGRITDLFSSSVSVESLRQIVGAGYSENDLSALNLQSKSDILSSIIYDSLRDSGARSKYTDQRLIPYLAPSIAGRTLEQGGIYLNSEEKILDAFKRAYNGSSKTLKVSSKSGLIDKAMSTLIDPNVDPFNGTKFQDFLQNKGFSAKEIRDKMTSIEVAQKEYKDYLSDIMYSYMDEGFQFRVTETGIQAKDSASDWADLVLPKMRISDNGTAYWQLGSKDMMITSHATFNSFGADPISLHSDFRKNGYAVKSSSRTMARERQRGNRITIKTLTGQIGYDMGDVFEETPDAFAKTISSKYVSGSVVDMVGLVDHMFSIEGEESLDSSGALDLFRRNHSEKYKELKESYIAGKKKLGDKKILRISDISTEFYERFTAQADSIFASISESTTDESLKDFFGHISAGATQEKLMERGMYVVNAPRYDTPLSNFLNEKRNTGYQNAKAPIALDMEKMEGIGARAFRTIESDDTLKSYAADGGRAFTARIDIAHMTQSEYFDFIKKAQAKHQLDSIEKTYGKDTFAEAMKVVLGGNVRNDGSFITADLANALPTSDINNKMVDLVTKGLYKIENNGQSKNRSIDALDMIPKISINSNGSVEVKYSPEFYLKRGSSLIMFDRDKSVANGMMVKSDDIIKSKRGAIASIRFFDSDNVRVDESTIAKRIKELNLDLLVGKNSDEQSQAVAKALKDKFGITMKLDIQSINLSNKIGYGEEKSYATAMVLPVAASKEMRDILDKYRTSDDANDIIDSITGASIRDEAFDVVARTLGMSKEDTSEFKRLIHSPTEILQKGIFDKTTAKNAKMFTNINEVKHESVEQNIAAMAQKVIDTYTAEGKSPEEIDTFFKKHVSDKLRYDAEKGSIIATGKIDKLTLGELEKEYDRIRNAEKNKYGDNHVVVTTQSINSAKDWEAGKTSGHMASELNANKERYKNGDITLDKAIEEERRIKRKYAEDSFDGVKLSGQELEVIGRQRYTDSTLAKFIGEESNDSFISETQKALERQGTLVKVGGRYQLNDSARDTMIYSGTYSHYKDLMLNGYNYEMNRDGSFVSADKREALDVVSDYTDRIRKFNKNDTTAKQVTALSNDNLGMNVIKATDIVPPANVAEEVLSNPNNPFTSDMVIDLGEDFDKSDGGRYVAVKGLNPKFFSNDEESMAIQKNYQKKLSSLQQYATDLEAVKNDTLSLEDRKRIFGKEERNMSQEDKINFVKDKMSTLRREIIEGQDDAIITNKKSINKNFASMRTDINAMLKSETSTIPMDGKQVEQSIYAKMKYNGKALGDVINGGHLVDYAVINSSMAEEMGLYDQADDFVEMLKKDNSKYYNDLVGELGENASNKDIMKLASQREGLNMFIQRYPTVHDQSDMAARIYVSDSIQKNTIFIPEYTQKKAKNDNDSDTVQVYSIADRFVADQKRDSELNIGEVIQATRNVPVDENSVAAEHSDPIAALNKNRALFSDKTVYSNISDAQEYEKVFEHYQSSNYRQEFEDIFTKHRDSVDFETTVKSIAEEKDNADEYVEAMKQLYVDKDRMSNTLVATVAQSSKAKVGYINNSVARFTSIGDQYTLLKAQDYKAGSAEYIRYHAANELINRERGDLIENVINAKNTANEEKATIVSDMLSGINDILHGNTQQSRQEAKEKLASVFDTAIGSKYDDYVDYAFKHDTYLKQYFNARGFTQVTDENRGQLRSEAIDLVLSIAQETPTRSNRAYTSALREAIPTEEDGRLVSDIAYQLANNGFTENDRTIKENAESAYQAAKTISSSVSSGGNVSSGAAAKAISQTAKNAISKNMALGAIGIAASILAVGIIGGNPSHAPQEDTQAVPKDAYRYDNYNYQTGTVNYPPMQMPQGQNRGYVVNMRASTNGSYQSAERNIAMATQQNYASSNYSFTMNRKFSYSAQQDNDAYVEGILNRLM